ncbi:sulfatase-like hydrolase/transferase [bacterium]|nr:sulfatase-like hydrolase/transferase [bacterium]
MIDFVSETRGSRSLRFFLWTRFHSKTLFDVVLLAIVLLLPAAKASSADRSARPNIVVIMADDLGYGDVSCYGATALATPNIDRLAENGLRFTSGYCSASTCTPTRYSLLTGTYAFRRKGTGIAPPNASALIKPGTETIASLLKQAGYRTAVIGKWHLGLGGEGGPDWNGELKPGPLEIGFDHCYLLPTTNDRVPQVYVDDHRVPNLDPKDPLWVGNKQPSPDFPTGITLRDTLRMDWSHGHNQSVHNGIGRIGFYTGGHAARWCDEDLADEWVKRSVAWIEQNKDEPFFLFFASHDLHVPRMPHERFQGKTKLGYRGDSIVQLDWCVGELVKTLDRLKLADNTLVVFCSDNGPVLDDGYRDGAVEKNGDHKPAGPYRGGKYSIFEGGTRTPFITYWPGQIKSGESDELVCTIDLAASLASLTGVEMPADACLDSLDVSAALLGRDGAKGRDHLVQQDNGQGGNFGLRVGQWKLQRHDSRRARNVNLELVNTPVAQYRLFDLSSDPGETQDVKAAHPEIARRLIGQLNDLIQAGRSRLAE